jgi:hypothetical protein
MKGNGPRNERETIINFKEDDETASVWTASEIVYRRLLKRLGPDYLTEDAERHAVFSFSRNFIDLPRAKAKRALDPAHRSKLVARMAEARKLSGAGSKNGHSRSVPK